MNTDFKDKFPSAITDRYEITRLLGEGGMSRVYLAKDKQLPREIAIKCILSELSDKQEVKKRIEREVQIHASIGIHQNIVTLIDVVEEAEHTYLIMEYVEGVTLGVWSMQHDHSEGEIISIITDVLHALKIIHARNIIHRDIKPENIIVSAKDGGVVSAKLMDFGISYDESLSTTATQLTQIEVGTPGSPAYMSPEQIDAKTFGEVGPASDLYSVGIILYELLTKSPPFTGTMTQILTGHLITAPAVDHIDIEQSFLKTVLAKALLKKQQERYTSAEEFLAALTSEKKADLYRNKTQLAVKLDDKEKTNKTQLHVSAQTQSSSRNVWLSVALILGLGAAGTGYHFLTLKQEKTVAIKSQVNATESLSLKKQTETEENESGANQALQNSTVKVNHGSKPDESAVLIKTDDPSSVPSPIDSTISDMRPIDPLNYIGPTPDSGGYSTGTQATDTFKAIREKKLEQASSVLTQKTKTKTSTSGKVTTTAKKPSNSRSKSSSSSGWSVTGSSSNKVN